MSCRLQLLPPHPHLQVRISGGVFPEAINEKDYLHNVGVGVHAGHWLTAWMGHAWLPCPTLCIPCWSCSASLQCSSSSYFDFNFCE